MRVVFIHSSEQLCGLGGAEAAPPELYTHNEVQSRGDLRYLLTIYHAWRSGGGPLPPDEVPLERKSTCGSCPCGSEHCRRDSSPLSHGSNFGGAYPLFSLRVNEHRWRDSSLPPPPSPRDSKIKRRGLLSPFLHYSEFRLRATSSSGPDPQKAGTGCSAAGGSHGRLPSSLPSHGWLNPLSGTSTEHEK
jgi:hypothetical protein